MTEILSLPEGLEEGKLLEALCMGIVILAADGRISWVNTRAAHMLGRDKLELIGTSQLDLPLIQAPAMASESLLTPVEHPESRIKAHIELLQGPAGEELKVISLLDVTAMLRAVKSRTLGMDGRDSARIDPLTTLLTRKSLLKELVSEVSRSRRYHNPLSIMLLRPYADAAAWKGLDEKRREAILKATAEALKNQLRWVDVAGRWDHDCLLLVLPETQLQAARQLADKISSQSLSLPGDDAIGLSIHCAVSEWRKGDDAPSLTARAEASLKGEEQDCSALAG